MDSTLVTLGQVCAVVREAASRMVRGGFSIEEKESPENLVTSSDIAVQHFLTEQLGALLPGCGFLCEEEHLTDTHHAAVWVIDPIDGTANYARGNENCAISVALVRDGEPVLGVVYSPWRDEMYAAEKGKGACCNGSPIRVSDRPFREGLLFTAMSTYRKEFAGACRDIIYDIFMESNDFRRLGSAAVELCLMAAGQAELYFEMRLMPWDYAAAGLILQEAGGCIRGFDRSFPSLSGASLVAAANSAESCDRLQEIIHRHLSSLPY